MLSPAEGAELARVSEDTLLEYSRMGFLKAESTNGGIRFSRAELLALFGCPQTANPGGGESEPAPDTEPEQRAEQGSLSSRIEVIQVQPEAGDNQDRRAAELEAENQRLLGELDALRSERAWLRERLEKLETRSERDQMLMLSELETIRGLARGFERRRGGLLSLLPWFNRQDDSR